MKFFLRVYHRLAKAAHQRAIYDEGELFAVLLQEDKRDREDLCVYRMVLEIQSSYSMDSADVEGVQCQVQVTQQAGLAPLRLLNVDVAVGHSWLRCGLRTLGAIQGSPRGRRQGSEARQRWTPCTSPT